MNDALRERARTARANIETGALRGPALRDLLRAVPFTERDAWVDQVLALEPPPPDVSNLPRGAVPYLPCGVDEILAMIDEAPVGPGDAFVDLGSGVGRVVVLAHLLSGAAASGIEIQEPLVRLAQTMAATLKLPGVSFTHADAAATALHGSHFFLYAPFNGDLLARVLARLGEAARRRPIVVGAVGLELHGVPWLTPRNATHPALTIYDSHA